MSRMLLRALLTTAWSEAQSSSQTLRDRLLALVNDVTKTLEQGEVISSHGAAGHTVTYHIGNAVINPQEAAEAWQTLYEVVNHLYSQNPDWTDQQLYEATLNRLVPYHRLGYDHSVVIRS